MNQPEYSCLSVSTHLTRINKDYVLDYGKRVVFIKDEDDEFLLHCEGAILELTRIISSEKSSSLSATTNPLLISNRSIISSFAYDRKNKCIAYAERAPYARISLKLKDENKNIYSSDDVGVEYEYSQLVFNEYGSMLAAVSVKGEDVPRLLLWKLCDDDRSDGVQDQLRLYHSLDLPSTFATHHCQEVAFDPSNNKCIAFVNEAGDGIVKANFISLSDGSIEVKLSQCYCGGKSVSAFTWIKGINELIVGSLCGSIFVTTFEEGGGREAHDCCQARLLSEGDVNNKRRSISCVTSCKDDNMFIVSYSEGIIERFELKPRVDEEDKAVIKVEFRHTIESLSPPLLFHVCFERKVIAFSPDGCYCLELNPNDRKSNISNLSTVAIFPSQINALVPIQYAKDKYLVAVAQNGGVVKFYKKEEGKLYCLNKVIYVTKVKSTVSSMISMESHPVLVIGTSCGKVYFIHVSMSKLLTPEVSTLNVINLVGKINTIVYNESSKYLAISCDSKNLYLIEANPNSGIKTIACKEMNCSIQHIHWTDRKTVFLSLPGSRSLIFDVPSLSIRDDSSASTQLFNEIISMSSASVWIQSASVLIIGTSAGEVNVYQLKYDKGKSNLLHSVRPLIGPVGSICLDSFGAYLLVAGANKAAYIIPLSDCIVNKPVEFHSGFEFMASELGRMSLSFETKADQDYLNELTSSISVLKDRYNQIFEANRKEDEFGTLSEADMIIDQEFIKNIQAGAKETKEILHKEILQLEGALKARMETLCCTYDTLPKEIVPFLNSEEPVQNIPFVNHEASEPQTSRFVENLQGVTENINGIRRELDTEDSEHLNDWTRLLTSVGTQTIIQKKKLLILLKKSAKKKVDIYNKDFNELAKDKARLVNGLKDKIDYLHELSHLTSHPVNIPSTSLSDTEIELGELISTFCCKSRQQSKQTGSEVPSRTLQNIALNKLIQQRKKAMLLPETERVNFFLTRRTLKVGCENTKRRRRESLAAERVTKLSQQMEYLQNSIFKQLASFDQKIRNFKKIKCDVDTDVMLIECCMARLNHRIQKHLFLQRKRESLENDLSLSTKKVQEATERIEFLKNELRRLEETKSQLQGKEIEEEKEISSKLQNSTDILIDQETLKILVALTKKRRFSSQRDYKTIVPRRVNDMEPFTRNSRDSRQRRGSYCKSNTGLDSLSRLAEQVREEALSLNFLEKCSEAEKYYNTLEYVKSLVLGTGIEVNEHVLNVLHQRRCKKFEIEDKIGEINVKVAAVKSFLAESEQLLDEYSCVSATLNTERSVLNKLLMEEENLSSVHVFKLKIEQLHNVHLTSGLISLKLFPRKVISNARLKFMLQSDKCRKISRKSLETNNGIKILDWRLDLLRYQLKDVELLHTDIHYMRLSAPLKALLSRSKNKGNNDDPNANQQAYELKKMQLMKSRRNLDHDKRVQKLKNDSKKVELCIVEKRKENLVLNKQLISIQNEILTLEEAFEGCEEPTVAKQKQNRATMKRITSRRKLVDLSRKQKHQIDTLTKELDRLRKRTFPWFCKENQEVL